jgi:hypothetical protein
MTDNFRQPASRLVINQTVAVSTSAASTNAFGSQTYGVRVATSVQSWIKIGDGSPVATSGSDAYLPANVPEYFLCTPGQKLSIIGSASGTATVTELG